MSVDYPKPLIRLREKSPSKFQDSEEEQFNDKVVSLNGKANRNEYQAATAIGVKGK